MCEQCCFCVETGVSVWRLVFLCGDWCFCVETGVSVWRLVFLCDMDVSVWIGCLPFK